MKIITYVIVTWNNQNQIKACIDSIKTIQVFPLIFLSLIIIHQIKHVRLSKNIFLM